MLEYFLTAFVADEDVERSRSLLQGYCAVAETHELSRVLFYRGPDRPAGFKKIKDVEKSANGSRFLELQRYLAKQSFIMTARYPVSQHEFGGPPQSEPLDKRPGTLRWSDLPDPVLGNVIHIQRKVLDIPRQENLLTILEQNNHTFKSECISESYSWWRDNVEYTLSHELCYPQGAISDAGGTTRTTLPAFAELEPLMPLWMLHVKVLVPESRPELSNQAVDLLTSVSGELGGIFEFQQVDRRGFDTRLNSLAARNNMPKPLPSVVTVKDRV